MAKEKQIKNIVYFFHNSPEDTLGYHRLIGPAQHLGLNVIRGFDDGEINVECVTEGDIVVIQRDFPRFFDDYERIITLTRKENKPVVLDLDDLLLELPEEHPDRQGIYYTDALLPMLQALIEADLVTVTTASLKEYIYKFNRNVRVLPNFLNDALWTLREPTISFDQDRSITIGYMGGNSHAPDLRMITPIVLELIERYPSRLQFHSWGIAPPAEIASLPQVMHSQLQVYDYPKFAATFQKKSADIFIAPLVENPFNSCKSAIKFLEYSALGVPGVYSDIQPYSSVIINGYDGYLASTSNEWLEYLSELIENPERRVEIASNAQETIRNKWLLSKNAHLWLEAYQEASVRKPSKRSISPMLTTLRSINSQIGELNTKRDKQIQIQSAQITEHEQQARLLTAQVAEREQQIQALTAQVAERDRQVQELTVQVADREQQIRTLRAQASEHEQQIQSLSAQLREITISKAWRLALVFRRIRLFVIPPGGWREHLIKKLFSVISFPGRIRRYYRLKENSTLIRKSELFDASWYLEHNLDVAQAGIDPVRHYLLHGGFEGRDPSPRFYSERYLEAYHDVKNAGINPLVHYLRYGKREMRVPWLKQIRDQQEALISVVIPVYDRTEVLRESIDSILNQSYQYFELLLVCDGSPPETFKIVNQYVDHPKVRIFKYKDNSGNAIRGRNRAIKEASGEYIAFQDSDDIADKNRLKNSLEYARKFNADVVYGGWKVKKERNALEHYSSLSDGQIIFSPDCNYETLKLLNYPCQSTVMAKTVALRKAGGLKPEMRYCEDYEFWLRLAYLGYSFKSIPEVLTTLRLHSSNLEGQYKKNETIYIQKALEVHTVIPRINPTIAFIIPIESISGGIAVISYHTNQFIKKGYDVLLVNTNPWDTNNITDWFPNLLTDVVSLSEVDSNIDIAIATHWSTAHVVKDMSAKYKIYFVQSDESRFYTPTSKEAIRAKNTYTLNLNFVVIANWLQEWLKEEYKVDSHIVLNGLDKDQFFPDTPLEPKNRKLRVLLEGPINIPFKGMEDAFKVVDNMDCEVWCVSSSGRPKKEWHCDKFFEKVPQDIMKNIYSSCDVLIKMSLVESFGMPLLEMMACGGTVISGWFTGIEEYFLDGYNGLLIPQGDIKAAREKLQLLINDKEMLLKLKKGALETAGQWPTWEDTNRDFEKVIIKLMKNNLSS